MEIRLCGYGRGREAYEVFDASRLDELRRARLIVGARRFPANATGKLLRDTNGAYAEVADRLARLGGVTRADRRVLPSQRLTVRVMSRG